MFDKVQNTPLQVLVYYIFTITQPTFACSKLAIETLEQGKKYIQS